MAGGHLAVGGAVGRAGLGRGEDLVAAVRAVPTPGGDVALVGGESAQLVDIKDGIFSRLPLAPVSIVVLATFVLLFLMFGSVLVPIKALVLNTLSLTATFGAMVWIFQDGNLDGFARIHRHRATRHHHAGAHVLHRLRAVDGLRGVPPVAHQGGVRPHRRQHPLGRASAWRARDASSPRPPC